MKHINHISLIPTQLHRSSCLSTLLQSPRQAIGDFDS